MMIRSLAQNWWAVALRGVLAVLFGVAALVWPGLTVVVLVYLFAAYAVVEGVFNLLAGFQSRDEYDGWWLLLVEGLVSMVAGVLAFVWPEITALVLLYLIASWAILTGVLEIVAAIRLRRVIEGELWLGLGGAASVLFGVIAVLFPGAGALAIVTLIAFYAIFFGVLLIGLGLRLRALNQQLGAGA